MNGRRDLGMEREKGRVGGICSDHENGERGERNNKRWREKKRDEGRDRDGGKEGR